MVERILKENQKVNDEPLMCRGGKNMWFTKDWDLGDLAPYNRSISKKYKMFSN